jgi:putative Holliday junction resolvase
VRFLGLDIGERRIGVAVSDPGGLIASPVAVIDARQTLGDGAPLRRILEDYEIEAVVVGLPLSLDGTEGPQAQRVRDTVSKLARFLPCEVIYVDERLSSTEAHRRMTEAGLDSRGQRHVVDKVAAALLLQTYLDQRASNADEQGGS